MNSELNGIVIGNVKTLYEHNPHARTLFEDLAARRHARKATSIDRIAHLAGCARGEAVALARLLEEMQCGVFKMGRRGAKSRFVWAFSPISLGKAAIGEDDELEEIDIDDLEDVDTDVEDNDVLDVGVANLGQVDPQMHLPRLTITMAREALAASLGVPVTCVEITIRST